MSDSEPIAFSASRQTLRRAHRGGGGHRGEAQLVAFSRVELNQILRLYGLQVAAGEWRDYAIDMGRDRAVFCVFRRASEVPLYRIEKNPALARKQGAFSVISATGHILKRGGDLDRVLRALRPKPKFACV